MSALQNLTLDYTRYNLWATQKIQTWLEPIGEDLLCRTSPSSFESLNLTLQHILRVQRYWKLFVCGEETSAFDWSVRQVKTNVILAELLDSSAALVEHWQHFSEKALTEVMPLKNKWADMNLQRWEYILHTINHSTYHRGQLITQARNLGITEHIPGTDYLFYRMNR
ncbi:MAG: DUF664 domain-containing protein [Bacteroidetes bacterium]|nr:DUF664 domain-containing protein [Bacteroidota bacterium]